MYLAEAVLIIILAIFRTQVPGEGKRGAADSLACKASVSTCSFNRSARKHRTPLSRTALFPESSAASSPHGVLLSTPPSPVSAAYCPFTVLVNDRHVLSGFMSHTEVISTQSSLAECASHTAERCACFQTAADKTGSWRTLLDCDRHRETNGLMPISLWAEGVQSRGKKRNL